MNRFDALKRWTWSVFIVGFLAFAFAGCEGDDGAQGPPGPQGPAGADGQDGADGADGTDATSDPIALAIESAKVESCGTCHGGVGEDHQAVYDDYTDPSNLALTITDVTSTPEVGLTTFTVTVQFNITDLTNPLFDAGDNLALMDEARFYAVQFDSVAVQYLNDVALFRAGRTGSVASNGDGTYVVTVTGIPYAPETPAAPFDGAQVYGYVARGALFEHVGGTGAEIPEGSHVHLYEDVANAAFAVGTAASGVAGAYDSAANVAGCEKCHGTPYLKHGYRAAQIEGIPDFAGCKSCHEDARSGGHEDWQYMVDDPLNWATNGLDATTVETKYAYTANIMNDTHMSHAMEFPYPQSMSNCVTCHEGKLDRVLADEQFVIETCKSCHPLEGNDAWPKDEGLGIAENEPYYQSHRAPPLEYIWARHGVEAIHNADAPCQLCHVPGTGYPVFTDLHTGYDAATYDAAGNRYTDLYTVSIDSITRNGDELTIQYSANDATVTYWLAVSFYGWDSKHFIVSSHERDDSTNCANNGCRFEYIPGRANPLFQETANSTAGDWEVVVDMAGWVGQPDSVTNLIADNTIRRLEVSVIPGITIDGDFKGLNAVSSTFDFFTNAVVDNWFKAENAIVDVEKCNVCHDRFGFHDAFGLGVGGNTTGDRPVCVNCHNPTFAGSHLEMASRSLDNYVHAIHTFQAFDPADVFGARQPDGSYLPDFDPVFAKRYDQHTKHVFPNFTIQNCEACHVTAGGLIDPADTDGPRYSATPVYNVPDQSRSMPGLASPSDNVVTWYEIVDTPPGSIPSDVAVEDPLGRNIGGVPNYVMGPASRACGGCHRARLIRDDAPGALASLNGHTEAGGTLVDATDDPATGDRNETSEILFGIIDKIMSLFE